MNLNFSYPKIRWFCLLLLLLFNLSAARATHNRAGEITIRQIGPLTIEATVTTYTKASSIAADRDTVTITWGDGTELKVARQNGPRDGSGNQKGQVLDNDTKLNIYRAVHNYPGLGRYTISMADPNRIRDILNVNPLGNSESVPFFISTTYTFLNAQFQGSNSTPILLQPPVDFGCTGQRFIHNPNAYDVDGDSISYHLIVPLQAVGQKVPNYFYPNQIIPGPNNQISLNPITGDFVWEAPQRAGDYNIAMVIVEYRAGTPIDTLIRDMQITILECENRPPKIESKDEICVIAGQLVDFSVIATDPDVIPKPQRVKLTALGGPLTVATSKAKFTVPTGFQPSPVRGQFSWQTTCEHISAQFYSVVFKAVDNFRDTTGLTTLKTVKIKIIGPPPEDVQAKANKNDTEISWKSPYTCQDAADKYFYGFSVWRKENSNPFVMDTCETGLEGKGYMRIAFRQRTVVNGRYVYIDKNVERGKTYCYRILAEFAKLTSAGNPYNLVESIPSQEICVQLNRDLPLMTHATVLETNATTGRIEVRWSKPNAKDLDTLQNPGPYRYQLFRATGQVQQGLVELPNASFVSPTFYSANDTVFIDNTLNTVLNAYTYRVAFYVRGETEALGTTAVASSVFLSIAPTDEANNLNWKVQTPWQNYRYDIFKLNSATGKFDSIGTTTQLTYTDRNLRNGTSYCYYVRSIGSYGIKGIVSPIINLSQEVCGSPRDNVPPCAPKLTVENICNVANNANIPTEQLENLLRWTNPNNTCTGKRDASSYRIYFSSDNKSPLQLLQMINNIKDTTLNHRPTMGIAGCYAVSATDLSGNESAKSSLLCVDNCPLFELPNAFTPNNDGQNDNYTPFRNRFIAEIDMQVFNRWGEKVFETKNPNFKWDGRNLNGEDLPSSVYYYTCYIVEQRVGGATPAAALKGFIQLIR